MANEFVTRKGLISLGGVSFPYNARTSNYVVTADDYYIDCNGTFTVTLPTSVGNSGRLYVIKNSGSGQITVTGTSSQTIDGSVTKLLAQYESLQIQSNGTNWVAISPAINGNVNVGNGLSTVSNSIYLGGTLSESTNIEVGSNTFTIEANGLDQFYFDSSEISLSKLIGLTGSNIRLTNDYVLMNSDNGASESVFLVSVIDQPADDGSLNNTFLVSDNINSKGIVYEKDYSSNFTTFSVVTKGYVDSVVASVGATNGLSELSPGIVGLGGTLSQDAIITTNLNFFQVKTSNGLYYDRGWLSVGDASGTFGRNFVGLGYQLSYVYANTSDEIHLASSDINRLSVFSYQLVVNDYTNDYDFKVRGITDSNLLVTDASYDRVGIGTDTPEFKLQVSGTVSAGDILPNLTNTYNLGSSSLEWQELYVASQSIYVGGVTISSNNDAISITKINLGTEENPTILSASGSDIFINGSIFTSGNVQTLVVAKQGEQFTSVKTAVESITGATANNVYTVKVRGGVYYEEPFTIPSYVAVVGESSISTIIQATYSSQTLVTLSDQSGIFDVQIQGCTDTGVAAVVYSSPTTPQTNAIAYVENVRFGANYTHAKVIGTGSNGNCIMQCSNVKYGGYPFTIGFQATNGGSGIGRMQLRNVTSTNGGIVNTSGLIFGKADASGCGFIVNGCLLTRSVGSAAGIGFQVENSGFLRLTGVNFQRWAKAIYAPNDSGTASIDAIALNFENNTIDVQIDNTKATGKIQGVDNYSKTIISATASLYVVNKDQRIITVGKKGSDFSSISSAVSSITDSSELNRYTIEVGPGIFYESLIDLSNRPYVSIVGSNIQTTQIFATSSSQHLIKMGLFNEISFMSLNNVGLGYAAIYADDSGDFCQAHKVSFYDCDTGIKINASTVDTKFYGEYVDFNGSYSIAVDVQSSGAISFANVENYYCFPGITGSIGGYVAGTSSELNVTVATFEGLGNDYGFWIQNGAKLNVTSTDINNFETGIFVRNAGTFSTFDAGNVTMNDGVSVPINAEHPNTKGFFQGSLYDHTLIQSNSSEVYWNLLDRLDGELNITRKLSLTWADGTTADASTLLFETAPMGVIEGGIISTFSGTTVSVSSGYGYLEVTAGEVHKRIDWSTSLFGFSASVSEYLYINENEILASSTGLPNTENNILLGRVVTFNGEVVFIDNTRLQIKHADNKLNLFNRKALGSIYETGSLVTAATFSLDVNPGSYWFGDKNFQPSGGSSVMFQQFYRDGSGGWVLSMTNSVTSQYDNNTGSLLTMSASYFTKHTLCVVGEGVDEKYLLVVGQTQYSSLVATEDASLPTPPTYFEDGVTPIASIYVQQGTTSIYQVEDIRPVIGFKSSGVNATSDHGNLSGLSDDDHQQYLLVTGARALTGNLQLGGNNITNVNLINGITFSTHAARHLPNGLDPLATGLPSDIGTTNQEGILNAFARQDHVHSHGDQAGGLLHATASSTTAGFMSSVDKTQFDIMTSNYVSASSTQNTYVPRWISARVLSSTSSITDNGQSVGVGTTNYNNSKISIYKDPSLQTGLYISANNLSGALQNYGVYLESSGGTISSGYVTNISSGQSMFPVAQVDGISNNVSGYSTYMYGINQTVYNSYSQPYTYGIFNDVQHFNAGTAYGFYNLVTGGINNIGIQIYVDPSVNNYSIISDGSVIFNDSNNSLSDFTVKGLAPTYPLFFADSSVNSIGIRNGTPSYALHVLGTVSTTGFRMTNGAQNEYIMVSDSSGNGSWTASRLTNTTVTSAGTTTTIATVSIAQGYTSIYEVYVSATCSNTIWGAWKRELVLTNFSGSANVVLTNAQMDKQSGLIPTNLSFTCSSSNLLIQVTGTTSQTVNWISKYEKIM